LLIGVQTINGFRIARPGSTDVRRIQRSSSWPPCGACRSCRAVGLRIEVSKETKQEGMVMTPREVTPEVLADQELVKTLLGLRPDALDFKVVYWVAPDGDDVTGHHVSHAGLSRALRDFVGHLPRGDYAPQRFACGDGGTRENARAATSRLQ
jgi:hypothetical protein